MTSKPLSKLPGVLSFRRGHIVSDAEMFSLLEDGTEEPIPVIRHGVRATQNVNDGKGNDSQKVAAGGDREVSNIQTTETAKLNADANALVIRFSLAMLDMSQCIDAVMAKGDRPLAAQTRSLVQGFIDRAKGSNGLVEVCARMARNIGNARWTWRNRALASSIEVVVRTTDGKAVASFDALAIPLNTFGEYSVAEMDLAHELARQMRGESVAGLEVTATLHMRAGGGVEVFPSQNYVEDKPKGFARPLYKLGRPTYQRSASATEFEDTRVTGVAAMRDQKVWNAIRTFDTWYPDYEDVRVPIPVEPLGASLAQQEFFRKGKSSSFSLLKRLGEIDPDQPDGMFCIAALERGGVYGESDKESTKPTEDATDAA